MLLTLATRKKASEESASLQGNGLVAAARPEAAALPVTWQGKGTHAWGVPATREVRAQLGHARHRQWETLHLFASGENEEGQKRIGSPSACQAHPRVPCAACISRWINQS